MFTRWRLFVRDWCMQWWRQPVGTQGDNTQKQMQQEFIAIVLEIHKCIRLITESFAFSLNLKWPNRNTACFLTRYLYSAMHIQCHQLQAGSWTVSTLCIWRRCFSKNLKWFGRLPAFVSKQRLGCRQNTNSQPEKQNALKYVAEKWSQCRNVLNLHFLCGSAF